MIKDSITYLNTKIEALGYFNNIICLAEKIEKENKIFPAVYSTNGDYKQISLDPKGSTCYWRKNGDVTISEEDNSTGIGIQYRTTVPLKFVGFRKKDPGKDDQYYSDNLIAGIISNLTINNSALKSAFKAKLVRVAAVKYVTDFYEVSKNEYTNIEFVPQFTHSYFSIDFNLVFVTANQCYADICNDLPINFGYVTIKNSSGNIIELVKCGGEYICGGGANIIVSNSDGSYSVATSVDMIIPDEIFNVYLNGMLSGSFVYIPESGQDINITITA